MKLDDLILLVDDTFSIVKVSNSERSDTPQVLHIHAVCHCPSPASSVPLNKNNNKKKVTDTGG